MKEATENKNTFVKAERLSGIKDIDRLFADGSAVSSFPLKLIYIGDEGGGAFQSRSMFVVPKKNFRKAHDRNRIKRRLREAFRKRKNVFNGYLREKNRKLMIAFLFTGKTEITYQETDKLLGELIEKLSRKL